jgi:NADH:ubiquinone oxidoreductase subunit F (NADH-binding)/NADH:ubiquinone oxidoreductase subunit E
MKEETIRKTIDKWGSAREHTMLILRELETKSGANVLDVTTLKQVASAMNLPESALAGFVEFYTMFKTRPRAKFVIRVCKSGPCHVMGSLTVFDALKKKLGIDIGEATKDGLFFIEKCECLGVCSVAPAMMINYDIHGNLTSKRIGQIIDSYKRKKPSLSEACGPEVEGRACVIKEAKQTKRLLEGIGVVDPQKISSYINTGGYTALTKTLGMKPDEIINVVKDSGLRGRGGAGFPAGMKWSFVTKGPMQKYVICNADEGEPGTFKDRILMEENPHLLLEGMAICGYAINATIGYIYVRGEYRRSIERLQKAINQARENGMLGRNIAASGFDFDIFIKEGGGAYVCGEEMSLINSMEGLRGYPRFKPPFPGAAGFKNLPSNVNNVETLMSVPMIINRGAEWYRSLGPLNCSGTKLYCLSGKLNRTGLVELPMGTTLRDIMKVYGSAGGILGKDLMDLPLDIDRPLKEGVTLGSGVVLVCDEDTCAVDFLLQIMSFFEHESCGQCVPCRVGAGHLHYIMKKFASRKAVAGDLDLMIEKATLMKKASLCALGQSPIMPILTTLKYFRKEFEKHCDPAYRCNACDKSLEAYYAHGGH